MTRLNYGDFAPWNRSGKTVMSLGKILLLSLAALSVKPSDAALKDPTTRHNNGTIVIDAGTVDRCISVDPSKYFKCLDTDSDTAVLDNWIKERGGNYDNSMYYASNYVAPPVNTTGDPEKGIAIFWKIEGNLISMAMIGKAARWVGFGLSASGGMVGSDVVLYNSKTDELEDAHVLNTRTRPIKDELQAWKKINSVRSGGFLIAEFTRALETGDGQDVPFVDDSDFSKPPSRFIAAWGDDDFSYHGRNDRLHGQVRFFGERAGPDDFAFREHMVEDVKATPVEVKYGYLDTVWRQVGEVPPFVDSTRVRCFEMADLAIMGFPTAEPYNPQKSQNKFPAQKPVHIVGIERIGDVTADKHIRRVTLYRGTAPGKMVCRDTGIFVNGDYDTLLTPTTRDLVRGDVIYAWAPGAESVAFPDNAGILFGDKPMTIVMEVAYHNPELKPRIIDHSGFTLWITEDLRPNNIGVARFGTFTGGSNSFFKNFPGFERIELLEGIQEHTFSCPSNCTQNRLPEEGVTVVREQLSMNTSPKAVRMLTTVNRDGTAVRTGSVDIYASEQNGIYSTSKDLPYRVLPGDSIETKCYYDANEYTVDKDEDKVIGNSGMNEIYLGSRPSTETRKSDEQCISILYYYPASDDIGLVCDVTTGRGQALPPGNQDQIQEDEGCVAVHSGKQIGVSSVSDFVSEFTTFGKPSGNEHNAAFIQLSQKRLMGVFLAVSTFIGLLIS